MSSNIWYIDIQVGQEGKRLLHGASPGITTTKSNTRGGPSLKTPVPPYTSDSGIPALLQLVKGLGYAPAMTGIRYWRSVPTWNVCWVTRLVCPEWEHCQSSEFKSKPALLPLLPLCSTPSGAQAKLRIVWCALGPLPPSLHLTISAF